MPLTFFSTSTFRQSIITLCKKERNGYHKCQKDICDRFKDLSFEDIWMLTTKLKDLDNIKIIKVRVPNSHLNLSAADSFRVIIVCDKRDNSIAFLEIYPKRGKLSKLDISQEEIKRLLKQFIAEKKTGILIKHDINSELVEIK